jgi:hypothetical protein
LGNTEQLARLFPPEQILNGLCFVCLNRVEPGVIQHLKYGTIVLGEFQRPTGPRTHQLAEMFRDATVPCKITDNLAQAQWEKLVWNIPFNGLGVAGAAGYEALVTQPSTPINREPANNPQPFCGLWRPARDDYRSYRKTIFQRQNAHEIILDECSAGYNNWGGHGESLKWL